MVAVWVLVRQLDEAWRRLYVNLGVEVGTHDVDKAELHAAPGLRLADWVPFGATSGHGHAQDCPHCLQQLR